MTTVYEPGRGPGPATPTEDASSRLLGSQSLGALATVNRAGFPHLSTVAYAWDPAQRVVRIGSTAGRAKVRQLAREPRAALYVSSDDHLAFAVAEGVAEVSPVSSVPGDETGRALLAMQAPFTDPEDEAVFLRNMVEDRRVVITLRVERLYGGGLDVR
ncbi:TIGR03618 family F420-dependent PPOX class oxidoreductase [Amycolatopsis australiensis]|uniref:PPOX class probable F420-dependent enzyme n=1 Tax=Amycolatopsis australiensis TaxID=546364 RepID=A0A1K1R002_9PSEU|nr:TIGR03618 family F420-dependent PPOX class oxidoreductase [Amycolatopsis australiensis]SFW65241.1 PPOX class probable F420-dependent enzyme [Amycolatopsis australiensis]